MFKNIVEFILIDFVATCRYNDVFGNEVGAKLLVFVDFFGRKKLQSGQITVLIRYLSGLSDDCLIQWKNQFFSIDNLSADRHKGEILLGCSYSGLNDNQRIST